MFLNQEIKIEDNRFIIKDDKQILIVQEWGKDTVRVMSSPDITLVDSSCHGIVELSKNTATSASVLRKENCVTLVNNDLKVDYDGEKLIFYNKDKKILEEFSRKQSNVRRTIGIDDYIPIIDKPSSSLNISPREFKKNLSLNYQAILRFEGNQNEKIFGLGGYQEEYLNKNGGSYELVHRNSQTSIPFYLSDKNYGFIWNNASIGEVSFNKNQKKWVGLNTEVIDYIVTVGETPKVIIENFTEMTGRAPNIDDNLLDLWQSKLRYQTTDEIKTVYNQYKQRNINLSVLVIDYFHWTADGDFEFDKRYWQGICELAQDMKADGTSLMVSLWPTVVKESKYYEEYKDNDMFIQPKEIGTHIFDGKEILDFSNPKTAKKLGTLLNKNYRSNHIELFWADQAEPEMDDYCHEKYLVYEGEFDSVASRYPYHYLKSVQQESENKTVMKPVLIRSAWFNSQKYGALAWSGDIESSFESLRKQIQIGLNMGISGIPWWTSDIAGFHSGDSRTKEFKELMIRWFQFAVFSPILRMHGDRQPHTQRIGESGGGLRTSGGPNEIWSFGEGVEKILTRYIRIREKLKKYIKSVYQESTDYGYPIMRNLFLEFPEDEKVWNETTNYMFGSSLLIVPIVEKSISKVEVYLPSGEYWIDVFTKKEYIGGQTLVVETSIETIPVFCKAGTELVKELDLIFT